MSNDIFIIVFFIFLHSFKFSYKLLNKTFIFLRLNITIVRLKNEIQV